MPTLALLFCSTLFMTAAWYGHLRFLPHSKTWVAILISWGGETTLALSYQGRDGVGARVCAPKGI